MNDQREPQDRPDAQHDRDADPVERLRDADPAAGLEAADGFADRVIERAERDDTGVESDSAGDDPAGAAPADAGASAPIADLADARGRRRRRWMPVVAAAAVAVVVGALGYGIGAATAGPRVVDSAALPPVALDGAPEIAVAPKGSAFDARMSAESMAGFSPYGMGRNTFRASGLSEESGTAAAYGYDARVATADTVGALAAHLGVDGTPEVQNGAWLVGPQDGSAPTLYVSLDGLASFSFSDPALSPWACGVSVMPVVPEGSVGESGAAEPDVRSCEPHGPVPDEATAIDALRTLIAATGRDADAFEYTSETYDGAVSRSAQAWPLVDGQRLDQSWYVEVGPGGLFSASGVLAEPIPLGDYPVVSEQAAFERLSDPRFGPSITAMPFAARESVVLDAVEAPAADGAASDAVAPDAPEVWTPPTEAPAPPAPGTAVSWAVNDVEIVEAVLGVGTHWQPDGTVLIVPTYVFTDADGGTWSVIAVADDRLDFSGE
ncbi:hypothetical protein [Agromyces sp. LHK192]|uniref:hypothetical protein n=1 Tax=Agromyces sp. LHK192 TaxID=2498704 RepID=UPI000FDB9029|nr:hypothetical protein [Agromyces sp. LHK192]